MHVREERRIGGTMSTTCVSTKGVVRHTELLPIGDNPDAEQLTTNSLISLFVKARDMA